MDIWDEIRLDEERRAEAERKLIAAEMAAWRALPQAEQERICAERAAKFNDVDITYEDDEDEEDEEDEDED
jgi:hypothetical protein